MTEAEIIAGVIEREGGFVTNPDDRGGPTKYGITAATLGNWRGLGRPASREEVWNLTKEEAQAIYTAWYVIQPGFTKENIPFEPLRLQLIDFGVNSGQERAVRWLQRTIGLPTTGAMNDTVVKVLQQWERAKLPSADRSGIMLVNDALCAARLYMVDSWTDADKSQKQFEEGVESRALSFFLAKP